MNTTFTRTKIAEATIETYKAACFRVMIEYGFILQLGEINQRLLRLFIKDQVKSAAFITAYNPFSQPTTEPENAAAQAEMEAEIKSLNLSFCPGQGEDPTGRWAPEVSALVMGIGLEQATMLGVKYQQNAIVWIGRDAKPQLLLLR
jgi:hypothetical protein